MWEWIDVTLRIAHTRASFEHVFELSLGGNFLTRARGCGRSIFTKGESLLKRRKLPRKG